eukprot:CAMPEP_0172724944 /NCGR_PEP_ID=MMETSP1074-20121228/87222_1 /TAXON_ID=2916 /ORGANISM="Ceratium fusus, Strain PA161109" /LENGTH=193 /DNA_ID=CAMNT_0013551585 /DNA_START=112 /DNA_END=693 /DNA_ORIENTATION=+
MSADDTQEELVPEEELLRCQEKIQGLQAEEQRLRTAGQQMRAELRRQRTETRIAGRLHQELVSGNTATRQGGSELLAPCMSRLEEDPNVIEDDGKPMHGKSPNGETNSSPVHSCGMSPEGTMRELRRAQQLEVVARGLHDELRRRQEVDSASGPASDVASPDFGKTGPSRQQVNNFCKRFALRSAVKLVKEES